jgi:RNA-directed DNA polymerase
MAINQEESGIKRPMNFNLLRFGFVPTYEKGNKKRDWLY